MTRRLAREEGLLVGGSSGMAVVAALRAARDLPRTPSSSCCCPTAAAATSARSSTTWMRSLRLQPTTRDERDRRATLIARARTARLPDLVHAHPADTVRDAIDIMTEYGVSQMPVLTAEPPVVIGEVVGAVDEKALLEQVFTGERADDGRRRAASSATRCRSSASTSRSPRRGARSTTADALLVDRRRQARRRAHPARPAHLPLERCLTERAHRRLPIRRTTHDRDGFATRAVHAGQEFDPTTGAVIPPIYLTSTFVQDGIGGLRGGYEYAPRRQPDARRRSRRSSPTLEGGERGLSFASGLAAEDALLRAVLRPGDHVVLGNDVYGGTHRLIDRVLGAVGRRARRRRHERPRRGPRGAQRPGARRVLWVETPSNPLHEDQPTSRRSRSSATTPARSSSSTTPSRRRRCSSRSRSAPTSSCTRPRSTSADTPTSSAAPSCSSDDALAEKVRLPAVRASGAVSAPMDAWLTTRGIKTLAVRMERHCENAQAIAEALVGHPAVERVYYPGLPDAPGPRARRPPDARLRRDALASRLARRRRGRAAVRGVDRALPARRVARRRGVAHRLPERDDPRLGASGTALAVPENVVRLSVGIEDVDDLLGGPASRRWRLSS